MWHPWRVLGEEHPHWSVEFAILPAGVLGLTCLATRTITLHRGMQQTQRRCTLTHELGHVEAGHDGPQDARTEAHVDQDSARRLIPFNRLLDAMRWTRDLDELADELWVDLPTLQTRIQHLHPAENAAIRSMLAQRETSA